MTRKEVYKLLTLFLEPYLKYGSERLFLVLDAEHLRIKTPLELTNKEVIIRKFMPAKLAVGLTSKEWMLLVEEVHLLTERFPGCLD